jgi:hypothetical protein
MKRHRHGAEQMADQGQHRAADNLLQRRLSGDNSGKVTRDSDSTDQRLVERRGKAPAPKVKLSKLRDFCKEGKPFRGSPSQPLAPNLPIMLRFQRLTQSGR